MTASPNSSEAAEDDLADSSADQERTISMHRTAEDRVVFTEEDNSDGWIATDLTIELER
jgi:hypothetical protein